MPAVDLLVESASLARVRAHLERADQRTLQWQATISSIPAPTGAERVRGEHVAAIMKEAGLRPVTVDAAGNVIGWHGEPGQGPAVVMAAHLDTVFGSEVDVSVRHAGPRLVGAGITDNARGLAAMLAVADAIHASAWTTRHPVAFVATVGEEGAGNLRGARHLFANGLVSPRAAVILDGAGDDRVVHRALGSRRFRIGFRGPGGHSWSAFGVANPAHAAGALAHQVGLLDLPTTPRTTAAVTRMAGGTSVNSIPEAAWLEIDLRSEEAETMGRAEVALRSAAALVLQEENARRAPGTSPLEMEWSLLGERPSGITPQTSAIVQAALDATRAIGRRPVLATASTDANIPISLGIPAIAVGGGGRAGEPHRLTEWYENAEGWLGIYRVALILAAVAELDGED
jgi:acetylornithine deacetylase/succinyl-diaminopimelate desuccinylase-like protein